MKAEVKEFEKDLIEDLKSRGFTVEKVDHGLTVKRQFESKSGEAMTYKCHLDVWGYSDRTLSDVIGHAKLEMAVHQ